MMGGDVVSFLEANLQPMIEVILHLSVSLVQLLTINNLSRAAKEELRSKTPSLLNRYLFLLSLLNHHTFHLV